MSKYIVKKENIFNFLKAQNIVISINPKSTIEIKEYKNIGIDKLQKVTLTNLNPNSRYWILNPETTEFLSPHGKKVENIIIEEDENSLINIFLIEMKSWSVIESDILKKFKISLSWVYLLLNLLDHSKQEIKVYGILFAQKDLNWNRKDTLNILSSTSIRYIRKSFFTTSTTIEIEYNNLF